MKQLLKNNKCLLASILIAGMLSACSAPGEIQGGTNDVLSMLQERRYQFVPQTANPTGARTRQLTADFFLQVSPDTIQSYLPYFGRAFSAPITPGTGAMDFTITNFEYNVTQGKKDRQEITIRPRGGTDVREMTLYVYPNGNASLIAMSNNRQPISYNGHVRSPRRR